MCLAFDLTLIACFELCRIERGNRNNYGAPVAKNIRTPSDMHGL